MSFLGDEWKDAIHAVARARGWPTSDEPAKLGALVRALSDAYNDVPGSGVARSTQAMAARLGFSFARDVPKCEEAVRELVATGLLRARADRPLRVLDVGAGLGATTWGLARALAATGERGALDATWVDDDQAALDVGLALARARGREGSIAVSIRPERHRASPDTRGTFDVVLLGQVLSELDPGELPEARLERHVELLRAYLRALTPSGSLVVVEPALRERTRHLHRVRDALMASRAATLFAPCLHAEACPALAAPGDWCHEDRAVDLPPWLAPVARAAGLRWQGLTFSYLVLRRDARTLVDALPPRASRLRVVSDSLVSKGKRELFVCGQLPEGGTRVRAMRLDRDADDVNAPWETLRKGDLVAIDPPPPVIKPRVARGARVERLTPASYGALDGGNSSGDGGGGESGESGERSGSAADSSLSD